MIATVQDCRLSKWYGSYCTVRVTSRFCCSGFRGPETNFSGKVGGQKTSGTPWHRLPSSGPFAFSGMRTAGPKQYTYLEKDGAKFHLKTREQAYNKNITKLARNQRKEARKIRKKLARRAARGGADAAKPPPPTPAADALAAALSRSDGLTPYQDEMRGRLTNTYHISVRAATERAWECLLALHFKTGKDGKDLTPAQRDDPILRPPLGVTFECKRALYLRYYRRLFVALRSLADGLSVRKCVERVQNAEELVGVIEKVKTPNKQKKKKASGLLAALGGGGSPGVGGGSPVAMMSIMSMLQRRGSATSTVATPTTSATGGVAATPPRRRASTTGAIAPSKAQSRWKMIQKEVCEVMSWRDLLHKRKEARAAKAASADELRDAVAKLAEKDWKQDSRVKSKGNNWEEGSSWYSVGEDPSSLLIPEGGSGGDSGAAIAFDAALADSIEVPSALSDTAAVEIVAAQSDVAHSVINNDNSHQTGAPAPGDGELLTPTISATVAVSAMGSSISGGGSSVVLESDDAASAKKRKKRVRSICEKQFRDGLVDIARLYAKSSSASFFTELLTQLREVVFHDIDSIAIRDALARQENVLQEQAQRGTSGNNNNSSTGNTNGNSDHGGGGGTILNNGTRLPSSPSTAAARHEFQEWNVASVASLNNGTVAGGANHDHFHAGWVRRRTVDLLEVQRKGRQKLWESSCRVQSPAVNDDGLKYRLDWGRGGDWVRAATPETALLSGAWPHMSETPPGSSASRTSSRGTARSVGRTPDIRRLRPGSQGRSGTRGGSSGSRRKTRGQKLPPRRELLEQTLAHKHVKSWSVGFGGTIRTPSRGTAGGGNFSSPW